MSERFPGFGVAMEGQAGSPKVPPAAAAELADAATASTQGASLRLEQFTTAIQAGVVPHPLLQHLPHGIQLCCNLKARHYGTQLHGTGCTHP
jgi:hypothetical protein